MNGSRQPNAVQLLLLELSNYQDTTSALNSSTATLQRHGAKLCNHSLSLYLDRQAVYCKRQRYKQ
jgi:hypothetical protein